MAGCLTDCGTEIRELHFSDLLILGFLCFVDQHVAGFDIYTIVSIHSTLASLAKSYELTSMYVAVSMECLQSLQNASRNKFHLRACQLSASGDIKEIAIKPPHNKGMKRRIGLDFIE